MKHKMPEIEMMKDLVEEVCEYVEGICEYVDSVAGTQDVDEYLEDESNWKPYEDCGEFCSKCYRPPYQFAEFEGELFYQCSCGNEWQG